MPSDAASRRAGGGILFPGAESGASVVADRSCGPPLLIPLPDPLGILSTDSGDVTLDIPLRESDVSQGSCEVVSDF